MKSSKRPAKRGQNMDLCISDAWQNAVNILHLSGLKTLSSVKIYVVIKRIVQKYIPVKCSNWTVNQCIPSTGMYVASIMYI